MRSFVAGLVDFFDYSAILISRINILKISISLAFLACRMRILKDAGNYINIQIDSSVGDIIGMYTGVFAT